MTPPAIKAAIRAHAEKSYFRYIIAGSINTGFGFAVYSAGVLLGLNYLIANFVAWASTVVAAFLLASYYVFRVPVAFARFPVFAVSNLLSLIASTALLTVFVRAFLMQPILSSVLAIPLVVAMNFFALKYVVFRPNT